MHASGPQPEHFTLESIMKNLQRTIASAALSLAASLTLAQGSPSPNAVDVIAPGEFTPAGRAYDVDFGEQKFRLEFLSDKELRFTSPDGRNTATVPITVTRIRPNVYMVYWSRRPGQHVVHIEDFENGVAWSNIFLPDGTAQRLKGTLVPAR